MITRRRFVESAVRASLGGGLGAAALGMHGMRGLSPFTGRSSGARLAPCPDSGALPYAQSRPVRALPSVLESVDVGGFSFHPSFTGDGFPAGPIPFHGCSVCDESQFPPASEEVDIAIIGGGVSGLATAYMLREHKPVVLELHDRFGGHAQGEAWGPAEYSLGTAYVISPDPGTFLDHFYRDLGLHDVVRVDDEESPIELQSRLLFDFFSGEGMPAEDLRALHRYRAVVERMAYDAYPEIPLPGGRDDRAVIDLDSRTLREDIELQMGMPVPPLLAAAIQGYCYSSFAAGWQEISAAAGWNFLAAEEFGRWVLPGGVSWLVDRLWQRLVRLEEHDDSCPARYMRSGCQVVDVRLAGDGANVTWADRRNQLHTLHAKRVVVSIPKKIAHHIMPDIEALDPEKLQAMQEIEYRPYVVANVLLSRPLAVPFYDIFLLGDGNFPMSAEEVAANSRVTDLLDGRFADRAPRDIGTGVEQHDVLTLYWPLPWTESGYGLRAPEAWANYASALVPQLEGHLALLGLAPSDVRQVRLTRWGHALPVPRPGFIASGAAEAVRRPIDGKIFFVNQDNWALPAVENCLLDAEIYAPQIEEGL